MPLAAAFCHCGLDRLRVLREDDQRVDAGVDEFLNLFALEIRRGACVPHDVVRRPQPQPLP